MNSSVSTLERTPYRKERKTIVTNSATPCIFCTSCKACPHYQSTLFEILSITPITFNHPSYQSQSNYTHPRVPSWNPLFWWGHDTASLFSLGRGMQILSFTLFCMCVCNPTCVYLWMFMCMLLYCVYSREYMFVKVSGSTSSSSPQELITFFPFKDRFSMG